jgi:regulator of RNase E activity RraB
MDKIEEFLLDAHNNGAINEELLQNAVDEALSSGVLEAVEHHISTQDKNNVIVTAKVKDKISHMLKNAAEFVMTDGRAIEMIDHVIGKHV